MGMEQDFSSLLRDVGLRVTKPRLSLLSFLSLQERPISIQRIAMHVKDANLATVYRMIETLLEKNIIRACDVGHGHFDYELAYLPHHHHVVCRGCGKIEEIADCALEHTLHREALKASRLFKEVDAHQATFYGVCKACTG